MENPCLRDDDNVELELGLSIGGSNSFKGTEEIINRDLAFVDPLMKREIHALRRQEAKKKREEKQLKKGRLTFSCRGNKQKASAGFPVECKRNRREEDIKNVNLNLSIEENAMNHDSVVSKSIPVQYPNPMVKYVPFTNGFAYPGFNWTMSGAERNVVKPVAGRSFRPFKAGRVKGCESEQNGSIDAGNHMNASSSHEAGGSSDSKSNSSHSPPEHHQLNGSHEHSASSLLTEISQVTDETTKLVENVVASDIAQSSPPTPKEEAASGTQPQPVSPEKPAVSNISSGSSEVTKGDMTKPPTAEAQNLNATPSLPHMPCVSTTGKGPNGKTINGFLYRYTKTEVSIICVCHGTSFSPLEFVQHAGGTDVTHPLRHITVIPAAF